MQHSYDVIFHGGERQSRSAGVPVDMHHCSPAAIAHVIRQIELDGKVVQAIGSPDMLSLDGYVYRHDVFGCRDTALAIANAKQASAP